MLGFWFLAPTMCNALSGVALIPTLPVSDGLVILALVATDVMTLFTVVVKLDTLVNVLYCESLLVRVVLNALVNKYEPIVLLNELVNSRDGNVLLILVIDVFVELTVDVKLETVVIVE